MKDLISSLRYARHLGLFWGDNWKTSIAFVSLSGITFSCCDLWGRGEPLGAVNIIIAGSRARVWDLRVITREALL